MSVEPEVKFLVSGALRNTPVTAEEVQEKTRHDHLLKKVTEFLHTRWPKSCDSTELGQFFQRKDSLSIVNDCTVFAEKGYDSKDATEKSVPTIPHRTPGNQPHEVTRQ
ncbi:unnamed protein product [Echinostoma caproni]|uniref:BLOC-1-related complex subunit 5 n=1 Tax=Echinostoma caproni TaxID=27848 RepID=A0A183A939_9TREM|nr:unnamed protein product [Echinostoma caproni]